MAAVGVEVAAVGVEGYEKFIILLHLKIIYAMPYYKNIKEIRDKNLERIKNTLYYSKLSFFCELYQKTVYLCKKLHIV
jgi:hypothetical protein